MRRRSALYFLFPIFYFLHKENAPPHAANDRSRPLQRSDLGMRSNGSHERAVLCGQSGRRHDRAQRRIGPQRPRAAATGARLVAARASHSLSSRAAARRAIPHYGGRACGAKRRPRSFYDEMQNAVDARARATFVNATEWCDRRTRGGLPLPVAPSRKFVAHHDRTADARRAARPRDGAAAAVAVRLSTPSAWA